MRCMPYHSLTGDYRFQGAGTPRKNMARSSHVCVTHSEEPRAARPRVVFASRMKPSIHLVTLWREILPISQKESQI